MATSVHIPKALLAAVDRKARALRVSRNRLIISALERETSLASDWSPGFFDQFTPLPQVSADAFAASMNEVRARRRSKPPPQL